MARKNVKLSTPWVIYFNELHSLFREDPEVEVSMEDDSYEVIVKVSNGRKYDALSVLLPTEKRFGNVILKVTVVPANESDPTLSELFEDAFANNPILSFTKHQEGDLGTFDYVVFAPKVIQYFDDSLFDYYGCKSTLAQEIAKEVFDTGDEVVCYCTAHYVG